MSTLRGRIGLTLLIFGLTTLLTVGGTLWVALRDLHREATLGSLAELTVPYAGILRARAPAGAAREPGDARRVGPSLLARLREAQLGIAEDTLATFVERVQDEVDPASLSVILIQDRETYFLNPVDRTTTALSAAPAIESDLVRGQVATGTTTIEGVGDALYAATPIRDRRAGRQGPVLVLAGADDSARRATADLVRALSTAALALLLIGIPIAVGLSRSVTRPLGRLAAATETVAAGDVPAPLPTAGPTEVSDASAAFNAMAAEVGASRDAQRQLLADIRHDLRTPLTVIGGFSEALRDGTASGDDAIRAADAISDETARLGRMLDDLDHLTMPGISGPPLHLETLDGRSIAQGAVERFHAEAAGRGQSIELATDPRPAAVIADRDALDRILGNLIANALDHAPSPGGHVRLEVSADANAPAAATARPRPGRDGVVLAVRDDGPGIPGSALPHVFDRFYRADPSRRGAGSGLGLAIVADLAAAQGGRAFADNLVEGGARVGIVLPGSGMMEA